MKMGGIKTLSLSFDHWPNASNTGPVPGTVLTPYSGPSTISTPGTAIDSKTINVSLTITADNVILTNCIITSDNAPAPTASGAIVDCQQLPTTVIRNCKLIGNSSTGSGILGSGTFISNDISLGIALGIQLTDGASTISGNYIHDLGPSNTTQPEGPHYDGITCLGGQNGVMINNNTIALPTGAGGTAVIFLDNDFASVNDVTIRHNLLKGLDGPAYTFQVVKKAANPGTLTNIVIDNNYMEPGEFGYIFVQNTPDPIIINNFNWNNGNPIPLTWPF